MAQLIEPSENYLQIAQGLESTEPPLNFSSIIQKSNQEDQSQIFDEKKLLSAIPSNKKHSASIILMEIQKRPNEITFNAEGTVFINEEAIPNSNIFVLFPLLFKIYKTSESKKKLMGYKELVEQLQNMGLGHLIVAKVRKVKEPSDVSFVEDEGDEWYYIGP